MIHVLPWISMLRCSYCRTQCLTMYQNSLHKYHLGLPSSFTLWVLGWQGGHWRRQRAWRWQRQGSTVAACLAGRSVAVCPLQCVEVLLAIVDPYDHRHLPWQRYQQDNNNKQTTSTIKKSMSVVDLLLKSCIWTGVTTIHVITGWLDDANRITNWKWICLKLVYFGT